MCSLNPSIVDWQADLDYLDEVENEKQDKYWSFRAMNIGKLFDKIEQKLGDYVYINYSIVKRTEPVIHWQARIKRR